MSGLIYHSDKRRVLPKIERIDRYDDPKPTIGEPVIYDVYGEPFGSSDLLISELDQWKENKTTSKAGEIISGALIDDRLDEVSDVVDFLIEIYPDDPFIKKILSEQKKEIGLNERIAKNRQQLKFEPKDALTWTDQAINYLEKNYGDKALRSIEAALSINKDNGFIVRIASRIFNLVGDTGRAIDVLKKSEFYRYDPQILSAEISFSQLAGRKSRGIDLSRKVLESRQFTPHHKTELSSAVGTFMHFHGDKKGAEKMFDYALLAPNENSLAQSLWYKKNEIPSDMLRQYSNSGEIQTHLYTLENDFGNALKYSLKWMKDESFSFRPYALASYISGVLFCENDKAFELLSKGVHQQEMLKTYLDQDEKIAYSNDQAYYLLRDNQIDRAGKYLQPLIQSLSKAKTYKELEHVESATFGLYQYKIGNPELGRKLYRSTISYFSQRKQLYNLRSAFLNFFCEEIKVLEDKEALIKLGKELENVVTEKSQNDLLVFKRIAIKEFNKRMVGLGHGFTLDYDQEDSDTLAL